MLWKKVQLHWHPVYTASFSASVSCILHTPFLFFLFTSWDGYRTCKACNFRVDALPYMARNHNVVKTPSRNQVRDKTVPWVPEWGRKESLLDPSLCCQPFRCHRLCWYCPVAPFPFVLFHSFSSHLSCEKDLQAEQDSVWNSGLS